MPSQDVELLAVGAGPSNLALAVALEEIAPALAQEALIVERRADTAWQHGLLLPWAQSQVSFLKDLVTRRNPRSEFTFINYLHATGRLDRFINLASFTPYRMEISDYLQWVAKSLKMVRLEYGRDCARIEPIIDSDGTISRWRAHMADGSSITCRYLVIGIGRDPYIPDVFRSLPADRLVHSTEFLTRTAGLDPALCHNLAFIGSSQSATEMLWAAHQTLPLAQCTLVTRSIGLNTYENSKFTNELYYPAFVDRFFSAMPEARRQVLEQMYLTNYGALSSELLNTLYRQMYIEGLTGTERIYIVTMSDVVDARTDGDAVVLTLSDRRDRRTEKLRCDRVLLGTGYRTTMPALIRDFAEAAGVTEISVTRTYRMDLPMAAAKAACYLQGVNELTHGISDSLLSVLSTRADTIVADLLAYWVGATRR